MIDTDRYTEYGDEESSSRRKAACGAAGKPGALPGVSTTRRKDNRAARRAVAMALKSGQGSPWRAKAVPIMKPEHEAWVRLNPATAEEIVSYVVSFTKSLPVFIAYGIEIDVLNVTLADDTRKMIEEVRAWAEKAAKRIEPLVKEGKPQTATPYADLHVITYASDRWIERHDRQERFE